MASLEELIIKLSADNADLKRKLADSKKDIGFFGDEIKKLAPLIAGAFAIGSITKFAAASFKAFEEQEKANRRLSFALKNNEDAFKALVTQANKFQSSTGVADDAIMGIQTLAAQTGKTTAEIQKITEATINWASLTGQDLQSAYLQINATLTGTAGRLTRVDAEFGNLTEAQLKAGGAIDLINTKYKDFAANSASNLDKLNANWEELKETAGGALGAVINPLLEEMNNWMSQINNQQGFWDKMGVLLDPAGTQNRSAAMAYASQVLAERQGVAMGKNADMIAKTNAMQSQRIQMEKDLNEAIAESTRRLFYNSKETEKSTESIDAWVAAYEKALQLAQYDVPQIGQFAGVQGSAMQGKGITQKVAPRKGWNTKREAESPLAGAIRLENKLMDEQMAKIDALSNSFGMLADIMGRNTLAYKAFAIAQATMDTYKAATMALATYPPPFGQIMMASTIALGLGNIAKISGAFAMGGIVGGGSYAGDKVLARVNSGEMILNTSQQAQLFAMANGGGGRSMEVYGRIKAGDIYLSNKRGAYLSKRRGS